MLDNTYAIDFEFNRSSEQIMNVIAGVLVYPDKTTRRYNLLDGVQKVQFNEDILRVKQDVEHTIVSYAASAESRALLSLGIDPTQFRWVDLYAEFRMLCNSNNKYKYGKYIDASNNIQFSKAPSKATETTLDKTKDSHKETPKNLINSVYRLLNVRLDSDEKEAMRDLILRDDPEEVKQNMEFILDYCESDTKYLRALDIAIQRALTKEGLKNFRKAQYGRARYSVISGLFEHNGMSIDMPLLKRVIEQTPHILKLHEQEVNKIFNFFVPEKQPPNKVTKEGKIIVYKPKPAHKDMKAYQDYVETLNIPNFPRTPTGRYKHDAETLEEWGYWGGLEALWKYNKTESSLKWFNKDNKNGFFDRMGSDDRVRPYFGVFGTQTGRNAAKAKTFPLAMSTWLRAIVRPPEGHCFIAADFSQQEVYVAAVLSRDDTLLSAYMSGDVYLDFAKKAGLAPKDATKSSHKSIRTLCKSTVLGIQFGMGIAKLQIKLSLDSGQTVSLETTKQLYDAHKKVFHKYWSWVYGVTNQYRNGEFLSTNLGFILFQDNDRIPSVRNFRVQGTGADILREALTRLGVEQLKTKSFKVMCGLHDATYTECRVEDVEIVSSLVENHMLSAVETVLGKQQVQMRIDTKIIHNNTPWVDEKGEEDWNKLKGFIYG